MDMNMILLGGLLVMLVALVALALMGPSPSRNSVRRLTDIQTRHNGSVNSVEARMRRAISNTTPEKHQLLVSLIPNPETLAKRIQMTGKKWTLSQYMTACVVLACVVMTVMVLRHFSLLASLLVGVAVGFGLPHIVVGKMIAKRVAKFTKSFPDALDLLVRGLRSGLPVSDTMGVVAREIPGPVGEEFRLITERVKIGKSMEQSMLDTATRLGTAEFKFFCITLAIQRETGGNLAETLANLGTVLRQRAQMKLKIKAMSSESKASAYIIGCLPFTVFGLISWINYGYMAPFYTSDPNGLFGLGLMQMVGIGGMCWMGIGAFIMGQMINFEI
ncbi:MAG TPA: type II secretion system F family protein [Sphingobium sp.]|uniref:type II secretion system F family protein n=1 Tax=Sphingobium sp. TaxID=1912891 RepID=UPI002ED3E1D5